MFELVCLVLGVIIFLLAGSQPFWQNGIEREFGYGSYNGGKAFKEIKSIEVHHQHLKC